MADNGLITLASHHAVKATIDRLETAARAKGLTIFARVDHAAGATSVGMPLRPTELLIFGNARGGTPLMQDRQTAGIDLPLKALAWEDADGKVWLTYNDAYWIAERHGLARSTTEAVKAIASGMEAITKYAAVG